MSKLGKWGKKLQEKVILPVSLPSPSTSLIPWKGLPWLHVALPNQNIALHFWSLAKKPEGKVALCVCVHSKMNESVV